MNANLAVAALVAMLLCAGSVVTDESGAARRMPAGPTVQATVDAVLPTPATLRDVPKPPGGRLGGDRACSDCLAPNTVLGDIGSTPWGYSVSGNCGTGGKWYAQFNGQAGKIYHFDLCPNAPGAGTGNFDADIKICDSGCGILAGEDGECTAGPNSYLPNDFTWPCTTNGTYYVVIAPYRSYDQHNCIGTASHSFTMQYYAVQDPCFGTPPPANDNCTAVTPVTLANGTPHTFSGNNACATNDCTMFAGGQVWEAFTLPASPTGLWDVALDYCGTSPAFGNAWLNLATGCPCSSITANGTYETNTCGDGNVTIRWTELAPGTYYYPVLLDPGSNSEGPYTLHVLATHSIPCDITCPSGSVAEAENCGSSVNNGCNMGSPAFESIACGQTKCGTAYFNGAIRDTDWYVYVATSNQRLTFTVQAEFEVLFGLIEQVIPGVAGCSNITGYVNPYKTRAKCTPDSVVVDVAPGTYYFIVAPTFAKTVACPAQYTATLTCAPIQRGACCLPDGSCVANKTDAECAALLGSYQGDNTQCGTVTCTPFYCPAGSGTCDEHISRVTVGNIDNPSGCGTGGYTDFTALSTTMQRGVGYPITVTNGHPYVADQCGIWVDWNHDKDFSDAGETITVSGTPGMGPYTATITPPVDALAGNARMRVRITYTGTLSPCGPSAYGDVEDYTIVIPGLYPKADMNCDGAVNNLDIDGFVLTLFCTGDTCPEYYQRYPNCDHLLGDMNGDGAVNSLDINGFVKCLVNLGCP